MLINIVIYLFICHLSTNFATILENRFIMPPKTNVKHCLTKSSEQSYLKRDNQIFQYIIGVDEAGRGPLAGPVVAGACCFLKCSSIDGIMDSKQTTEKSREELYEILTSNQDIIWDVSIVSHEEIDEINILQASLKAMKQATEGLLSKISKISPNTCIALIDGNKIPLDMPVYSQFVIKGDSLCYSIAAASIIAKVTRDRIMVELDKKYPLYNLAQHKGYPTFEHRTLLLKHGASEIHRKTFGPVRLALESFNQNSNSKSIKIKNVKKNDVLNESTIQTKKRISKITNATKNETKIKSESLKEIQKLEDKSIPKVSRKRNLSEVDIETSSLKRKFTKITKTINETAIQTLRRSTRNK